jgi:1-acyl-sn-glycerol-3-phosphate acyltransferase
LTEPDEHAILDERLAALEDRMAKAIGARRRQLGKAACGRPSSQGAASPLQEMSAQLSEQVEGLQGRIAALERDRRARRERRRDGRHRWSQLANLVSQARRLTRLEDVDEFGLDRTFLETIRPFVDLLYDRYFRVEAKSARSHVPAEGPVVLVANRGGLLSYDALMIAEAVRRAHPTRRLRFQIDPFLSTIPGLAPLLVRLGGVRAIPANAERLLESGQSVLFFPEGFRAAAKPLRERYRLGPMATDFAKVALRLGVPVVPVAVLGSEEAQPVVGELPGLASLLGWPRFPLAPAGVLALPVKFKVQFGKPIPAEGPKTGPLAGSRIRALRDRARAEIDAMLHDLQATRVSVFLG